MSFPVDQQIPVRLKQSEILQLGRRLGSEPPRLVNPDGYPYEVYVERRLPTKSMEEDEYYWTFLDIGADGKRGTADDASTGGTARPTRGSPPPEKS